MSIFHALLSSYPQGCTALGPNLAMLAQISGHFPS